MREILFRGKRVDNGEWVEGYVFERNGAVFIISNAFSSDRLGDGCLLGEWRGYQVIPETVGQYTWQTDENGYKIFEGHIIKAKHYFNSSINYSEFSERKIRNAYGKEIENYDGFTRRFIYWINYAIEYSRKKGMFIARNGSDQHPLYSLNNGFHCVEVIGNIHDNPELLTGRADG